MYWDGKTDCMSPTRVINMQIDPLMSVLSWCRMMISCKVGSLLTISELPNYSELLLYAPVDTCQYVVTALCDRRTSVVIYSVVRPPHAKLSTSCRTPKSIFSGYRMPIPSFDNRFVDRLPGDRIIGMNRILSFKISLVCADAPSIDRGCWEPRALFMWRGM
jgi:hypothetical protein